MNVHIRRRVSALTSKEHVHESKSQVKLIVPVFPDPGEELFSSLLDEEEKTPPDVFSDLSTVLLSTDL